MSIPAFNSATDCTDLQPADIDTFFYFATVRFLRLMLGHFVPYAAKLNDPTTGCGQIKRFVGLLATTAIFQAHPVVLQTLLVHAFFPAFYEDIWTGAILPSVQQVDLKYNKNACKRNRLIDGVLYVEETWNLHCRYAHICEACHVATVLLKMMWIYEDNRWVSMVTPHMWIVIATAIDYWFSCTTEEHTRQRGTRPHHMRILTPKGYKIVPAFTSRNAKRRLEYMLHVVFELLLNHFDIDNPYLPCAKRGAKIAYLNVHVLRSPWVKRLFMQRFNVMRLLPTIADRRRFFFGLVVRKHESDFYLPVGYNNAGSTEFRTTAFSDFARMRYDLTWHWDFVRWAMHAFRTLSPTPTDSINFMRVTLESFCVLHYDLAYYEPFLRALQGLGFFTDFDLTETIRNNDSRLKAQILALVARNRGTEHYRKARILTFGRDAGSEEMKS